MKLVVIMLCAAQLLVGLQTTAATNSTLRYQPSKTKKLNKKLIASLGLSAAGVAMGLLLKHHDHRQAVVRSNQITGGSTGTTEVGFVKVMYLGWGYPVNNRQGVCFDNNEFCNGMNQNQFIQALKLSDTTYEWHTLLSSPKDFDVPTNATNIINYPYENHGDPYVIIEGRRLEIINTFIDKLKATAPPGAVFQFRIDPM